MSEDPQLATKPPGAQFASVPIEVTVTVGRARPPIRELVEMGKNSVLELDRRIDDPVELVVGGKVVARGTLEEGENADGHLSVRLTEVVDLNGGAG